MYIVFYGTGSCMPSPKTSKIHRSYTGWGIKIGKDSLLFDIGGGVLQKMLSNGINIMKEPTHLFISHFHPDHCSDILALLQGRGVANFKFKIEPLVIGGPEGLKQFINEIFAVTRWESYKNELKALELIDLHEVKKEVVYETKNWKVSASPIDHYYSVCYKLEVDGKTIIYSGDMVYDERILEFGRNADVAILECSYPDRKTLKGKHLCPEDIGKLAKLGKFKKVILTHMYPECEGREDEMVSKIKKASDTEVVVAYDNLQLSL